MLQSGSGFALSRSMRVLLPLGVAVLAASALLAYDAVSSRPPSVSVAGEAKMQMLRDEHALIADYLTSHSEARKLADAAADREIAHMRLMAQGEMQQRARIAEAEEAKAASKADIKSELKTAAVRAPVRVAGRDPSVSEPQQVVQMTQAIPPQVAAPVQARTYDGPVRSRLRQLVTDVRSLPSWFSSAADWVVDAVPSPKLPSLPGRQFRAEI